MAGSFDLSGHEPHDGRIASEATVREDHLPRHPRSSSPLNRLFPGTRLNQSPLHNGQRGPILTARDTPDPSAARYQIRLGKKNGSSTSSPGEPATQDTLLGDHYVHYRQCQSSAAKAVQGDAPRRDRGKWFFQVQPIMDSNVARFMAGKIKKPAISGTAARVCFE